MVLLNFQKWRDFLNFANLFFLETSGPKDTAPWRIVRAGNISFQNDPPLPNMGIGDWDRRHQSKGIGMFG